MKTLVEYALGALLGSAMIGVILTPSRLTSSSPSQKTVAPNPTAQPSGGGGTVAQWHKTKATFYGTGGVKVKGKVDYDDGKTRLCADGSVYKSDGLTCAAWTGGSGEVLPLGAVIEVKRGKIALILKVTDRQQSKKNRYIDLPTFTWDSFGAKRSIGTLDVEWRRVK